MHAFLFPCRYEGSYGSPEALGFVLTDWVCAPPELAGPVPALDGNRVPSRDGGGVGAGLQGEGMFAEKLLIVPPSKFPSGDLLIAGVCLYDITIIHVCIYAITIMHACMHTYTQRRPVER